MKQSAIFRKRFDFIDYPEIYRDYNVMQYHFPVFFCETSLLVTDSANLFILKEDIQQTHHINPSCRIIVIVPVYQVQLIRALFPEVEVVRNDVPLVFSSILTGFSQRQTRVPKITLTNREEVYLDLVRAGMKDCAISKEIGVSARTLKRTKEQLLEKTGLCSSTQLAMFAVLHQNPKKS